MVSTSQINNWTKKNNLNCHSIAANNNDNREEKEFEEIYQKKSLELLGENNSVEIRKNKVHPG